MISFASFFKHTGFSIMILFLFSSATALSTAAENIKRSFNLKDYSVGLPTGEKWKVEIDKRTQSISFVRHSKAHLGGGAFPLTYIRVTPNWVVEAWGRQFSEEEIANNYREKEIADMQMLGVKPGLYEVYDIKKDITILDGKKLYTLSNTQKGGEWYGTDKIGEQILYIYFPPNFKETYKFYLFIMSEIQKIDERVAVDLTPIFTVIKSLRLK